MNKLFSMNGRLSRSSYATVSVTVTVAFYVVAFVAEMVAGQDASEFISGIFGLVSTVIVAFAAVKRLHDMDRPGWHYWLLLVPLYNFYLSLVLILSRGTVGRNQYGDEPGTRTAAMHREAGGVG